MCVCVCVRLVCVCMRLVCVCVHPSWVCVCARVLCTCVRACVLCVRPAAVNLENTPIKMSQSCRVERRGCSEEEEDKHPVRRGGVRAWSRGSEEANSDVALGPIGPSSAAGDEEASV